MGYKSPSWLQEDEKYTNKSLEYMIGLNKNNNFFENNSFSISNIFCKENDNTNLFELFNPPKKHKRKYDPDCLRKKIKHLIIKYSLEFINSKIDKKNKIKKIIDNQIKNTKIMFEREFMYKSLGDIFSTAVSKKYKKEKKPDYYNINKINELKLINNDLKNIFNIEFLQCLNHFIGKKTLKELNGMKTINEITFKNENEKLNIIYYASNYEENVLRAMPRNYD